MLPKTPLDERLVSEHKKIESFKALRGAIYASQKASLHQGGIHDSLRLRPFRWEESETKLAFLWTELLFVV
jgi:hypothetical protein